MSSAVCLPVGKTLLKGNFTHKHPPHISPSVIFHGRSSSIEGRLPSKVIVNQRSSSSEGRHPSKVVFHQRSSLIKGRLPSKVIFRQSGIIWNDRKRGNQDYQNLKNLGQNDRKGLDTMTDNNLWESGVRVESEHQYQ